ncbi:MAG: septum formation initiator family protein [Bacteroidia bacterium]|nr:septum formation initiator family protein [Bacteroidia bacterium]MCZ2277739.1 septum formation initiator family protein [Bacteroidia bacterium]
MRIQDRLKQALPYLKNKYVITLILFLVWISFFDQNSLITQYRYRKQLNELEEKKAYYLTEIEKNKQDLDALMGDKKKLEKFAREKYLMKKENEDIFLIIEKEPEKSNQRR